MVFVLIGKISSWRNTIKEKEEQNLKKFVLQSDLMMEKKNRLYEKRSLRTINF